MGVQIEKFIRGLTKLRERGLKPEYSKMLGAHWAAPRRTVSMAQLAKVAGYPDFRYANLRYGMLAKRIADNGNIRIPPGWGALRAIAHWSSEPWNTQGHFAFTMWPELASALERLDMVRDAKAPPEPIDPIEFLEGEPRRRMVTHRERERLLRDAKIQEALRSARDGRLRCQVPGCGFDFEAKYGSAGAGYAQVHHLRPLSTRSTPSTTRLIHLAVVCANCHAIIHRFGENRPLKALVRRGARSSRDLRPPAARAIMGRRS